MQVLSNDANKTSTWNDKMRDEFRYNTFNPIQRLHLQDGKVSETDRLALTEMLSLFQQRAGSYGKLRVSVALYRQPSSAGNQVWRNILTRFQLTSAEKDSNPQLDIPAEQTTNYDYGDFVIREFTISKDEFPILAEKIVNTGRLAFEESKPVVEMLNIDGSLGTDYFSPSLNIRPSNDPQYKIEWPTNCFKIEPTPAARQSPPGTQLVSLGLPLYEYGSQAISEIFGIDPQIAQQSYGQVIFLLPNFTAKIAGVKLGSNNVSMNFKIGRIGVGFQELILKMYCQSRQKNQSKQFEGPLEGEELNIPLDFISDIYSIYLLTKKGEVLDFRHLNLTWVQSMNDVEIENTPENLEQIIARGESELVEFKLEFPKNNEDFAETVVAMSNGHGGTIFVGVNDDTSIIGIQNPRAEESIRDSLRFLCEPTVYPEISKQEIMGKTIIVVQLKEGNLKPYVLKNKGPYVRFGSSDRIATRDEIIQLCNPTRNPFGLNALI